MQIAHATTEQINAKALPSSKYTNYTQQQHQCRSSQTADECLCMQSTRSHFQGAKAMQQAWRCIRNNPWPCIRSTTLFCAAGCCLSVHALQNQSSLGTLLSPAHLRWLALLHPSHRSSTRPLLPPPQVMHTCTQPGIMLATCKHLSCTGRHNSLLDAVCFMHSYLAQPLWVPAVLSAYQSKTSIPKTQQRHRLLLPLLPVVTKSRQQHRLVIQ